MFDVEPPVPSLSKPQADEPNGDMMSAAATPAPLTAVLSVGLHNKQGTASNTGPGKQGPVAVVCLPLTDPRRPRKRDERKGREKE